MACVSPEVSISRSTAPAVSEAPASSTKSPISEAPFSLLKGWLRLVASGMASLTSRTCSGVQPERSATSSSVGSRSSSADSSFVGAGHISHLVAHVHGDPYGASLVRNSPLYRLTVHQVAYVENLYPRSGSNFSTAFISPMLPSWMRSSKGRP